jgi:dienelactone hydrolase
LTEEESEMKNELCTALVFFLVAMLSGSTWAADKQEIEKQIKSQVDEIVAAIDSGKKAEEFKVLAEKVPYSLFIMEQSGKFLVHHPALVGVSFMERFETTQGRAFKSLYESFVQATSEGLWVEEKLPGGALRNRYSKRTKDDLIVGGFSQTMRTMTPFVSPSGRGPIVIVLSGASGPEAYKSYAAEVAQLGYYAVLLHGLDISTWAGMTAEVNLRRTIEQVQQSPDAKPGKVAVIGFSTGGGGALAYAAHMPDLVSAVITYYPSISEVLDMKGFAGRFQVPTLVLTGGKDTHDRCCLIESMKAMEASAKDGGKPFELVVYPEAYHAFNMVQFPFYRAEDTADAWQRTIKMLGQYSPLR